MLIIVVLLFGFCWFPLQLYNILQVTWESVNEYRYINIIWFCSDWLAMSNSCYNPFIYGIYNVSHFDVGQLFIKYQFIIYIIFVCAGKIQA